VFRKRSPAITDNLRSACASVPWFLYNQHTLFAIRSQYLPKRICPLDQQCVPMIYTQGCAITHSDVSNLFQILYERPHGM